MSTSKPAKRTSKAKPAGVDMSSRALRQHYVDEAARLNLILDHADEVLIENACATIDTITALQRSIDTDGAVIVSPNGGVKNNPATTEIRQQRLALSKLQALIAHNFTVAANEGRLTSTGAVPGSTRGPYVGTAGAAAARKPRRRNQPTTPRSAAR